MQIHRTQHTRGFTILPNALLQDRRLSYTARGVLGDLLSRPDGWSEDGRRMADTSPQGRLAVAKALRELRALGYYRVVKVRRADGTFVSEAHVYDTPQPVPGASHAGPGPLNATDRGANPVKNPEKAPTLPRQRSASTPTPAADDATQEAVATLYRALRPEPRLRLGTAEALALAPLVATWLERGYGQRDLTEALLTGLPERVHSAPALLRDRLTRKLPPQRQPSTPARPHWTECEPCGRPIPHQGICRACAGLPDGPADTTHHAQVAARGRAKIRAALLAGRPGLPAPCGA